MVVRITSIGIIIASQVGLLFTVPRWGVFNAVYIAILGMTLGVTLLGEALLPAHASRQLHQLYDYAIGQLFLLFLIAIAVVAGMLSSEQPHLLFRLIQFVVALAVLASVSRLLNYYLRR